MAKKYILMSMEDSRLKAIAEVLSNKTSKKIIDFLSTKDASEKDIADALKLPINTTEYNLKKLIESGMVETTKNFFWSAKGKKIKVYKLSNKSIVISPKSTKISSTVGQILPVGIIAGIATVATKYYFDTKNIVTEQSAAFAMKAADIYSITANATGSYWLWFLLGSAITIGLLVLFNAVTNYISVRRWRNEKQ